MKEVWKLAVGHWRYKYYVSNLGRVGRVLSSGKHRTLRGTLYGDGYRRVGLISDSGKYTCMPIHRLVAFAFLTKPEWGSVVHHINHEKDDNRLENLCWSTHSHNTRLYYEFKNEQETASGSGGLVGPTPLLCCVPLAGERPSQEDGDSSPRGGLVSVKVPSPQVLPKPVLTVSWSVSLGEGVCFDSRPEHGYTTHGEEGV